MSAFWDHALVGSRPGKTRSFDESMKTRLQAAGQGTEHLRPGEPQGGDQDQDRRYKPRRTTRPDNESVRPSALIAAGLPGHGKRNPRGAACGSGEFPATG